MPQHMVVVVAGQQALAADHYTLPQGIDIGTFDPALRLQPAVRRVHAPGDLITIDSRHDLFDVMVDAKVLVVKFFRPHIIHCNGHFIAIRGRLYRQSQPTLLIQSLYRCREHSVL